MEEALSSWNDGAAKSAILDFVARVIKNGEPDYVQPADRVATFDNDGTLWCEQPFQVQVFFLIDRIKERVPVWKREHYVNGTKWIRADEGWEDARCAPAGGNEPGAHHRH